MSVYYNEIDPRAAAWLRQLMADGLIPEGVVDERSIAEVGDDEPLRYTQCHFFAGVGGWARSLALAEWPDDRTVWTGSCPCQPFSNAGKRQGERDARHLWPEFFRLIEKCRPPTVIGEQVASKAGRIWLSGVRADLETLGYAVGGADLCAAGVGAPHIRQRLWWVADADCGRLEGRGRRSEQGRQAVDASSPSEGGRVALSELGERDHSGQTRGQRGQPLDPGTKSLRQGNGASVRGRIGSGGPDGGVPNPEDDNGRGREWTEEEGTRKDEERRRGSAVHSAPVWNGPTEWHRCADGRFRRIPSQSVFRGLDDGVLEGLDLRGAESCYPLSPKIKGRVPILKGYGNAIVPQVGAEFIKAYMEITG